MKDKKWFIVYSSKTENGEVIILPVYYTNEAGIDVIMTFPSEDGADKVRLILNHMNEVIDSKSIFLKVLAPAERGRATSHRRRRCFCCNVGRGNGKRKVKPNRSVLGR